jgi:hypothetical protein
MGGVKRGVVFMLYLRPVGPAVQALRPPLARGNTKLRPPHVVAVNLYDRAVIGHFDIGVAVYVVRNIPDFVGFVVNLRLSGARVLLRKIRTGLKPTPNRNPVGHIVLQANAGQGFAPGDASADKFR